MSTWIIIPARKGSKGFPGKNRKLFKFTASIIPKSFKSKTIVTTDDLEILEQATEYDFIPWIRPDELANDEANIKDVLLNAIKGNPISEEDIVIMLYLTYPKRKFTDVFDAIEYFKKFNAKSLLCREEYPENIISPYRVFIDMGNSKGAQITPHDFYRRQDYPKVFFASHFIFIAYAKEIENLNKNLWNHQTIFFPINTSLDVDTEKEFKEI
jgi:CMP-N-acetylneuraminic acid synthetase